MTVDVLAAVAQFERDLLIKFTQSELQRGWAEARNPAGGPQKKGKWPRSTKGN
jgi:hypothetical protein